MHVFLWIFQKFYNKQYGVVVYGHSVKYSYEIPNEYLSGSMAIFLLAYVAIFSDSFIFGKATSSQFFRVPFFKVSQEFLFRSSSFFRVAVFFEELFFQNSHFFQHFLLVQSETSTQKLHLENRKFFSAATSQNIYPQHISTEQLLFQSRFFCTTSTSSKKARFWKRLHFQKSKIPYYLLFLESYLFNAFFINRNIL